MDRNLIITFAILGSGICLWAGYWEGYVKSKMMSQRSKDIARDDRLWAGCLAKPVSKCAIPKGYGETFPCPDWLDCQVPEVKSARQMLVSPWWTDPVSDYDYVRIVLDSKATVIHIDRRHYDEWLP